jgi:replicative DNA helicase
MREPEENVSTRRAWAERYPNEDTYGSIIVGWLVEHPDVFASDWRLANLGGLTLSKGWLALLKVARGQWRQHGSLTHSVLKRSILADKRISNRAKQHLGALCDWAREAAEHAGAEDFDDSVHRLWMKTRRMKAVNALMDASLAIRDAKDDASFETEVAKTVDSFERVRSMGESRTAGAKTMAELARETQSRYGSPRGRPMPTGLLHVDMSTLGGMRKSELWMLAGYAKQGKSTLARQIAYNFVMDGRRVFWAGMEQGSDEERILFEVRHSHAVQAGGIRVESVLTESLTDEDLAAYFETARRWQEDGQGENLVIWCPEEDVTIEDVIHRAEIEHRKEPVDLLVVDYSELLVPMRRRQQYRIELSDTIRRCKTAANGFGRGDGVVVLLLHQISRKGYDDGCKRGRYVMRDLAETAAAERHSNVILWLLRTKEMEADHEVLVGIAAQRLGENKLWKGERMFADYDRMLIGNM